MSRKTGVTSKAHVEDRIRTALGVHVAASDDNEAHVLVEPYRLRILLVDREIVDTVLHDGLLQKSRADASATPPVMHEEHLETTVLDTHEGNWRTFFVLGDDKMLHTGQGLWDVFPDAEDLRLVQETVRCPDRRLSDGQQLLDQTICPILHFMYLHSFFLCTSADG